MSGKLYVVGTPIGNLDDISKRALEILKNVDAIVAEDTRVTLKLLNRYGIKKKLYSNHKFSDIKKTEFLVEKMLYGKSLAIVSDAGMPCICDPGEKIVSLCHEKNIPVFVVPGPCALICALSLSGLSCKQFTFFGFLSTTNKNRIKSLQFLKELQHTIVLYEAPHKLLNTLKDLLKYFNDRKIVIVKEITKIHESVEITTISKALNLYEEKDSIKGEYVLVIEGMKKKENTSIEDALDFAKQLISNGDKISDAAKKTAINFNFKKSLIYKKLLELN